MRDCAAARRSDLSMAEKARNVVRSPPAVRSYQGAPRWSPTQLRKSAAATDARASPGGAGVRRNLERRRDAWLLVASGGARVCLTVELQAVVG